MPLDRPRRIFRSGSSASRGGNGAVRPTVIAGLIGVLGGAALMLFFSPSTLFGRVPQLAGQLTADAPQVAVVDGQTLRMRELVVRLQGVVAPMRGQDCLGKAGTHFDCGAAASEALAALVRGHAVICTLDGRDDAGFPQGMCEAGSVNINRAVVAGGWARTDDHTSELGKDEAGARAMHLGIWRAGETTASF